MKKYFLLLITISIFSISNGQNFAVALDKMNVFYVGVDNPITIAVENIPNKSIVVRATNGVITGENGKYVFRGVKSGGAEISIYKKTNSKQVKIGSTFFRVKKIPAPVFKIGPARPFMAKVELANQQFVRAELEFFDFDARFSIDSFTVCIVPNDTCKYAIIKNIGAKINEEILNEFQKLKENDVVIFKKIFAKAPDNTQIELMPVMITISK